MIDTTPPAAPVVTSPAHEEVVSPNISVRGTAEAGSTVTVSMDGGVWCTSVTNASNEWECLQGTALVHGIHVLSAVAKDAAGNESASAEISFTVDGLAPQSPRITSPRDGDFIKDATLLIAGTAEAGNTLRVELDGQSLRILQVDASGSWSLTLDSALTEGSHTVRAIATDAAGHSASSATVTFTLDQTPPETRLSNGSPWVQNSPPSARLEFFSEEEGVTFECSLDGASFSACSSPITFENLELGEHTFQVRARDRAGNADPTPAASRWTHEPPVEAEEGGCSAAGEAVSGLMAWLALALWAAVRRGR
jgi:uncharacterized protein (TIGR03382 family)